MHRTPLVLVGIVGTVGTVVAGIAGSPPVGAAVAVRIPQSAHSVHPAPAPFGPKHPSQAKSELSAANAVALGALQRPVARVGPLDTSLESAMTSAAPVEIDIRGDMSQANAAVRAAGGRVRGQVLEAMTATVPGTALAALGHTPGIARVQRSPRPIEYAVTSQGVGLSGAGAWQAANPAITGAGVKVAIIDAGFKDLPAAVAAQVHAPETDLCLHPLADQHGSAVADIVHDMAPAAQLYLYCVDTPLEVNQAEQAIVAAGIKIITTSLGWPGDSRGDGTGGSTSVANAARDARQRGVLWINAAGNEAQDHWSGTLADANGDGLVDLNGPASEGDSVYVAPGGPASVVMSWDQWPTSNLPLNLILFGYQCESTTSCVNATPLNGLDSSGNPIPDVVPQTAGTSPVLPFNISNSSPTLFQYWDAYIGVPPSLPGIRYDLTWEGDVSPSYLSGVNPARAAAGSLDPVASSPYAMAVGAVDASGNNSCGDSANTVTGQPLENFSAQGPTIDGRQKPDIVAYDGTASNVYTTPFCGTSASAPHVAGAAALVAQANPGLDASQLEYLLEQRADHGVSINPTDNKVGHGALTLGATDGAPAPAGSTYTPLSTPVRVLDTRTGIGRPGGAIGPIPPIQSIAVTIAPATVPATATAVSVNVTGVSPAGHAGATFLGVFPGGSPWPGTSNVNLSPPNDTIAAASTIVTLGPGGVLQVQNGGVGADAILDVTGYFTTASGGSGYTPLSSPTRTYDARNGGGALGPGRSISVHPVGVPAGATSVLINLTATLAKGPGWFNVSPAPNSASSALNFQAGFDRANMAIVGLDSGGSFVISDGGSSAFPIADVEGYFAGGGGAKFVPLVSPVRIMDTRNGNGGRATPLGVNTTYDLFVAGLNGVPYSATAVVAGVTLLDRSGSTWLTAFAHGSPLPNASNLNATAGRVVPNGVTVTPGSNFVSLRNNSGSIDLITDLFGYFH